VKNNQPVSHTEREFKEGAILASKTDLKGIITYANEAFIEISGFTQDELIGHNHNVVRHPDMPPEAFEDLWNTVKQGKPWTGLVKNRCKNGDHYWVKATVTPVKQQGQVVEYMSVRVKPTAQEVAAAEALYREVNAGKATLKKSAWKRFFYRLRSFPISGKLSIAYSALIAAIAGFIVVGGVWKMQDTVAESERVDLQEHYLTVLTKLDSELRLASALAALVAEIPQAQEAFANGERERLDEMFTAPFQRLQKEFGVRQFQFHKPPATSFTRIHKLGKFGDDLTQKRPTIVKTNQTQAPVVGLDIGVYGLGLRGLTPVFKDGKHLGSVEFGMSFDNTFFDDFKARYGIDLALDLFRGDKLEAFASTLRQTPEISPEDAAKVLAGETLTAHAWLGEMPVGILRAPLRDYAGEVVGVLQIVADRSMFVGKLDELRNLSWLTALVAVLIGLLVSYFIARSITRPLTFAVDVAQAITEGKYNNDIQIDREDETGQVLMAMQAMQSRLHYDVHTVQEALGENLRVRSALDKVHSCVTVSDGGNTLIYMNESAVALFEELGRKITSGQQPFDPMSLLGTSLADFFPDEQLRKTYQVQLRETKVSQLDAWGHTLKLVTSPVLDQEGAYQGRATQWIDITDELAAQAAEHERLEAERQVAAANLRLKVALDNVSSNVMVADENNNIIYMNETALKMFSAAEADIRRDLPRFEAARIIGSNVDVFHKNPAHQQALLTRLKDTHQAGFDVGGRTMRFVANPVVNDEGQRLGTVVEWTDRTNEVAVEKEIDGIVDSARAGDLSRRIELVGKSGFFLQLGNGINALIDEMERVFTDIASVMEPLAKGDLTGSIRGEYAGTFGKVKGDINESLRHLEEVIVQLRESADVVATASDEITSGNTNLSGRTEQQASSLQETASSMEELTSTVRNNADNAQQANALASNARSKAEQGGEVVKRAVQAMEAINTSSAKIAEIISVIDEIAFQTNLLALNASVEAARAGEQGRGFAVVATEVRNLASRSAAAAKEIKELIQDSVGKVRSGAELVNESGATLEEIVGAVKKVGDIVAEIAAASAEQSAGIDQVNQAVTSMDEVTQQNAALAEQTSAASASLNEKAKDMEQLMSFFTISRGSMRASSPASAPAAAHWKAPASTRRQPPPVSRPAAPRAAPMPTTRKPPAAAMDDDDEWDEF
jgi:methyl-accepting chemotaxis protein